MVNNVRKRVLVVFGGRSSEHDISIITGVTCLNCLIGERFEPVPIYLTEEGWFTGDKLFNLEFFKERTTEGLQRVVPLIKNRTLHILKGNKIKEVGEIYSAINCCHGLNGEDGSVSGVMRLWGVPFASPDMLASSVCMDKSATKIYLEGIGVKVVEGKTLFRSAFFQNRELVLGLTEKQIGYPCIIKPARLGSSIGISCASDRKSLKEAVESALRFDSKVVVEKKLENFTEVNCAVYRYNGRMVVSSVETVSKNKMLTFDDKYKSGLKHANFEVLDGQISDEVKRKIQEVTAYVYRKLYAVGVIRMDFLVKDGEVYLNEVNTVPGSLALYLFKNKTSEFKEVLLELIEEGVKAHREFENGIFSYPTDLLNCKGYKMKGAKRHTNG